MFASGQFTMQLEWRNPTLNPAINLYKAAPQSGVFTNTGSTDYLTDANTAGIQSSTFTLLGSYGTALGIINQWPWPLPQNTFALPTDDPKNMYFLFEGAGRGQGQLVVRVYQNSTKIAESDAVDMDLRNIKELYERWTVGDGPPLSLGSGGGGTPSPVATISRDRLPSGVTAGWQYSSNDPGLSVTNDPNGNAYILFVHGYNMQPWEKDAFAETALKRLYWQGYKGKFGAFQWPANYHTISANAAWDYDWCEWTAWQSAVPMQQKFSDLYNVYTNVYVLAHSHGNVVVGEVLRLAAQAGSANIAAYVSSQAAVPVHCYDPSQPRSAGFFGTWREVGTVLGVPIYKDPDGPTTANIYPNWLTTQAVATRINFFNVNDWALARAVWETDEALKPDTSVGPHSQYGYTGDTNIVQDLFFGGFHPNPTPPPDTLPSYLHLGDAGNVLDRYEIMAFAAEPRCRALGTTANTDGFASSVNLQSDCWGNSDPFGHSYSDHCWHSAQFRFTNADQQNYWKTLLGPSGFNLP